MTESTAFTTDRSPEINQPFDGSCGCSSELHLEARGDHELALLHRCVTCGKPIPLSSPLECDSCALPYRPMLEPAENMALTIALAQIDRGEEVPPNTTAVLIFALDRICRGDDA